METKLTLKLDADSIDKAKIYARDRNKSLSSLVEDFFRSLAARDGTGGHSTTGPIVRELSGILSPTGLDGWKDERADWLGHKYG